MKSIKEAEQITGITTQNIRYYEKTETAHAEAQSWKFLQGIFR